MKICLLLLLLQLFNTKKNIAGIIDGIYLTN
jgi:hypothetical protein